MRIVIILILMIICVLAIFGASPAPTPITPASRPHGRFGQTGAQPALVEGTVAARLKFGIHSGLITVPVRVNGSKELRMYLDTGMSAPVVVLFHKESIAELGLKTTNQVFLGGAGGEGRKAANLAPDASVEIGSLRMPGQTLIIIDESRQQSGWFVDGIIGKSLFDRFLTEIDYEGATLMLYDPADAKIRTDAVPISIDLAIGIPIIEGTIVIGGGKEISVRLAVDLGNRSALILNEDGAKGVSPPQRTIKSIGGRGLQGEISAAIGRVGSLKLGTFAFKDIPTAFLAPGTNAGLGRKAADGNAGSQIWNKFRVVLDYRAKKLFLVPNSYFGKPFPFNMAGLVLEQDRDDIYFVRHVIENSPASESGIQEGDKIKALNGVEVAQYAYREVLDIFNAAGRKVEMILERDGRSFNITLKLRTLI